MTNRRTVLIIDDDEAVREVVADMFELLDINVISAGGGREGLSLYRAHQHEIDLVLLDVRMPDLDGVQTYKLLRQINPDVAVIFSSGYTETDEVQDLVQPPSPLFLPKPYDMDVLIHVIEKVTGKPLM